MAEPTAYKPNDWNDVHVVIDANILRQWVNKGGGGGGGAADEEVGAFGPIALHVGGAGEVRFRDVSYRDLSVKHVVAEHVSPNYRKMQLTPFYYSFASAAADFDRDGHMDVVSGPFILMGPDFTKKREFYLALATRPGVDFSSNWLEFAGDFTGDGWPDVLLASTSNTILYVNPKGEPRRWDAYRNVIPPGPTVAEVSVMKDIDGDGQRDLVYMSGGAIRWAKPDPANPTGPWLSTQVGEPGTYIAHGIGAGDINGDKLPDILNPYGWWEHPGKADTPTWKYHPQPFGRSNGRGSAGGAEMCVYDVNGDGLNDVVTALQAHGFGLAWFEQKRDASKTISFVRHMISDDFASKNAGGVTFSEPHGSTCADMDGDGISDFVVGKRFFSHQESTTDPDPLGAPVLYIYKTVRKKAAPGGAEFVPELVHNASGAGFAARRHRSEQGRHERHHHGHRARRVRLLRQAANGVEAEVIADVRREPHDDVSWPSPPDHSPAGCGLRVRGGRRIRRARRPACAGREAMDRVRRQRGRLAVLQFEADRQEQRAVAAGRLGVSTRRSRVSPDDGAWHCLRPATQRRARRARRQDRERNSGSTTACRA